jgi:hypothetical protein
MEFVIVDAVVDAFVSAFEDDVVVVDAAAAPRDLPVDEEPRRARLGAASPPSPRSRRRIFAAALTVPRSRSRRFSAAGPFGVVADAAAAAAAAGLPLLLLLLAAFAAAGVPLGDGDGDDAGVASCLALRSPPSAVSRPSSLIGSLTGLSAAALLWAASWRERNVGLAPALPDLDGSASLALPVLPVLVLSAFASANVVPAAAAAAVPVVVAAAAAVPAPFFILAAAAAAFLSRKNCTSGVTILASSFLLSAAAAAVAVAAVAAPAAPSFLSSSPLPPTAGRRAGAGFVSSSRKAMKSGSWSMVPWRASARFLLLGVLPNGANSTSSGAWGGGDGGGAAAPRAFFGEVKLSSRTLSASAMR